MIIKSMLILSLGLPQELRDVKLVEMM
ncbi:MAG: hypothetical protein K0S07_832, partial [Chlamydiales bacterium]|nr:hypothetical protein [Chlamydiales bacterium]MDF2549765.1 hypothetical protein [Chlamydiales bacterium]